MSYTLETLSKPPSYRRMMETRTSYSRTAGSPSSGFRSQTWSRGPPSTAVGSSYKRANIAVPRAYSSTVLSSSVDSLDFSQSSGLNGDFKLSPRSSEKEQLQGLNDRFAGYIEKVHYLEQQNKEIEAEIQALRQKQTAQSQFGDLYDQEIRELRSQLELVNHEKAQIQLDTDHLEEDLQRLKDRYDEEVRLKDDTEVTIRAMKKDMEEAALIKSELDKRVQSMQDEVAFLRSNHEEEVGDLLAQIQTSHIAVERKDYLKADISAALKEIRSQLECHSDKNLQHAEDWFKTRYAKLSEAAEQNKEAIKSAKEEIAEYRRQLQSKTIELESVRGTKESLERQLNDIEERHNNDLGSYQETIHQLENELWGTKSEMARHLREYQDLLNVKMALDIEIAAYRKLLEGEETRFFSFPGSTGPSFSYRQPTVPTKIQKSRAEAPKLKVQHKFVEEIIEETKVEDEKSELDVALAAVGDELAAEFAPEEEVNEEEAVLEEDIISSVEAPVESAAPEGETEEEEGEAKEEDEVDKSDKEAEEESGEEEGETVEEHADVEEEETKDEEEKEEAESKAEKKKGDEVGEKEGDAETEEKDVRDEGGADEDEQAKEENEDAEATTEKTEDAVEEKIQSTTVAQQGSEKEKAQEEEEGTKRTEEEDKDDTNENLEKGDDEKDAKVDTEMEEADKSKEASEKEDEADEEKEEENVENEDASTEEESKSKPSSPAEDVKEVISETKAKTVSAEKSKTGTTLKGHKDEDEKPSEEETEKDAAVNGDIDEKDESEEDEKKTIENMIVNGIDVSPSKEDIGEKIGKSVVVKKFETSTIEGSNGTKHIKESVVITKTVEQFDEHLEQEITTKMVEKSTSHAIRKEVKGSE